MLIVGLYNFALMVSRCRWSCIRLRSVDFHLVGFLFFEAASLMLWRCRFACIRVCVVVLVYCFEPVVDCFCVVGVWFRSVLLRTTSFC